MCSKTQMHCFTHESGVESIHNVACRAKASHSCVSSVLLALGNDSLRSTHTTSRYTGWTGNHTTNQGTFAPLNGCMSIQLHAEAVLSMSTSTAP